MYWLTLRYPASVTYNCQKHFKNMLGMITENVYKLVNQLISEVFGPKNRSSLLKVLSRFSLSTTKRYLVYCLFTLYCVGVCVCVCVCVCVDIYIFWPFSENFECW